LARKKKRKSSSKKKKKATTKTRRKKAPEAPPAQTAESQQQAEEPSESATLGAAEDGGPGDGPAIDLDADLDSEPDGVDLDAVDAVERLIAETLATPGVAEAEPERPADPVRDLDAEVLAKAEVPVGDQAAAEAAVRAKIDLGPVSSPEVRDRLLAQALAHAEHKDARYRVPFSEVKAAARWKISVATLLFLIAGLVVLVPPQWARPAPPAQLGQAERALGLRSALLLQAQQVEAFRVRTARLPTTLDEVMVTLPGIRYVRSGSRAYQLILYEADGNAIVYDSANPAAAFQSLVTGWVFREAQP